MATETLADLKRVLQEAYLDKRGKKLPIYKVKGDLKNICTSKEDAAKGVHVMPGKSFRQGEEDKLD